MINSQSNTMFAASANIISPHPQGARAPATSPKGEEKEETRFQGYEQGVGA